MVGAFGAGPEDVEFVLLIEVTGIEVIDGCAKVTGSSMVFGVGGNGDVPVVDGGEVDAAVGGLGGFD